MIIVTFEATAVTLEASDMRPLYLRPEQQVSQLCEGEEDDEEHHAESGHVFGATGKGGAQLGHGLVEGDVLEELDPGNEDADCDGVVEELGPVALPVKLR